MAEPPAGWAGHSHAFPLIINSLAQLDETDLLVKILRALSPCRELILPGLTNQGRDLALMALASILDFHNTDIVLIEWLKLLVDMSQDTKTTSNTVSLVSEKSTSQIRIVRAIFGVGSDLSLPPPGSPNIVSSFHAQVAESVRGVIDPANSIQLNAIDSYTGYEIDIRIHE